MGLPRTTVMMFNRSIWDLWPKLNRALINKDIENAKYQALEVHQSKYNKNNDTQNILLSFPQCLQ